MSPEQGTYGSLDIDGRSDICSLGIVLYELLTGHTPFDARELRKKGYEAILRIIREEDPPKASTRLRSLSAEELSGIADHRSESPGKLSRELRGELAWILLKALERDRSRRYDTAKPPLQRLRPSHADPPGLLKAGGNCQRTVRGRSSLCADRSRQPAGFTGENLGFRGARGE